MSPTAGRRLAQLITLGACGLIAWWACAPITAVGPSPAPLPETAGQMSGGITASYGPSHNIEKCLAESTTSLEAQQCEPSFTFSPGVAAGNLHMSWGLGESWEVGGLLGGGLGAGVYLGAYGRWFPLQRERLRLGAELQGGGLWVAAGMPLAIGLSDRVWLTTNPSLGYRVAFPARLPVGVSLDLSEHWRLTAEVAAGYGGNEIDGGDRSGPFGAWGSVGLSLH